MSGFLSRMQNRVCYSIPEGGAEEIGNAAVVADTNATSDSNTTHPLDHSNPHEGVMDNVRSATVRAFNEAFLFLEQRVGSVQGKMDDVAQMREELEELRQFREWADPQLEEQQVCRIQTRKISSDFEEHDPNICFL